MSFGSPHPSLLHPASLPTPTAGDGPCPPLSGRLFSLLTLPLRDDATGYGLTWRPRWVTGARWVSSSEARTNMGPVPRPSTQRAPCLQGPSLVPAHPSCRPASVGGFAARAPEKSLVPAWGGRAGGLLQPAAARSGRSDLEGQRRRSPTWVSSREYLLFAPEFGDGTTVTLGLPAQHGREVVMLRLKTHS